MSDSPADEARLIVDTLADEFPSEIDGRDAILELKEAGYNWKQMEWIGWYFEYKARTILQSEIGGHGSGPAYGNTEFDYSRTYPWDMKAHTTKDRQGYNRNVMILNDQAAIESCIRDHGGIGFIVAHGIPEYDNDDRDFYHWHRELKGGKSKYVREREERGASSRIRKRSFDLEHLSAYFFDSIETLREGVDDGWLGGFQEGMRNADGSAREAKYKLYDNRVPDDVRPIPPREM